MGEFLGRLAILCGLPRSGKSTYARTLRHEQGFVVICPDEVRLALHGQSFCPPAEAFVWATCELMARSLLQTEHAVLIDATNTTAKRRKVWLDMARSFGIDLEAFVMETPVEECHERNEFVRQYGSNALPRGVIDRMAEQWEPVTEGGVTIAFAGMA